MTYKKTSQSLICYQAPITTCRETISLFKLIKSKSILGRLSLLIPFILVQNSTSTSNNESQEVDMWGQKISSHKTSNIHLTAFKESNNKDSSYVIVFVVTNITRKNTTYKEYKKDAHTMDIQIFISGSPFILGYFKIKNKKEFDEIKSKLDETTEVIKITGEEQKKNSNENPTETLHGRGPKEPPKSQKKQIIEEKLKAWKEMYDKKGIEIKYKNFNLNLFVKRFHTNFSWIREAKPFEELKLDEAEASLTFAFKLVEAWEIRILNYHNFGIRFEGYKGLYDEEAYVYFMEGKQNAEIFTKVLNVYRKLDATMVPIKEGITFKKVIITMGVIGVLSMVLVCFYRYKRANKRLQNSFVE